MIAYLYNPRPRYALSRKSLEIWKNGGGILARFLHHSDPQTLSQLSGAYLSEYGWQTCPPTTTPTAYLPYLMCGLVEHGFARVACPDNWPITSKKPTTAFQLNTTADALKRRENSAVWRTHGQIIGTLLQTVSPLTLDDMDAVCREHAQRDDSFILRRDNKMTLAESLLTLAEHDLVQMILPRELRRTFTPLMLKSRRANKKPTDKTANKSADKPADKSADSPTDSGDAS